MERQHEGVRFSLIRRRFFIAALQCPAAFAATACDDAQLRQVADREEPPDLSDAGERLAPDAGERLDAGPSDAGQADAGEASGAPDAGHPCVADVVDAGVEASCDVAADFCDRTGDIDRGPATDFVAAWSRQDGDVFTLEVQFAGLVFTGGDHTLSLYLRLLGAEREMGLGCGDGATPAEEASSRVADLYHGAEYRPERFEIYEGGDNALATTESLDVCTSVFISDDGRAVQLRVPVPQDAIVESYWLLTWDAPLCDQPDGHARTSFVTSGGGAYGVGFQSVCDAVCPLEVSE